MKDKNPYDYFECLEHREIPMLKEELAPYLAHKKQGEYTIEDYYGLPDDQRVELIDGVIYDMTAPTYVHQGFGGEIYAIFLNYIIKNKGNCMTFISPADIQLNRDNKTMVQPDVFIICDRDKLKKRVLFGAPDLIVEILSPSTRKKDIIVKTRKYRLAGVREYWIVDPMHKQICVHEFEKSDITALYSFDDKVPVGIWDGKCVVDFKEIYGYLRFLDEEEDVNTNRNAIMNTDADSAH